jgi:hypothetical protein
MTVAVTTEQHKSLIYINNNFCNKVHNDETGQAYD